MVFFSILSALIEEKPETLPNQTLLSRVIRRQQHSVMPRLMLNLLGVDCVVINKRRRTSHERDLFRQSKPRGGPRIFGFVLGLLAISVTYVLATDSLQPPATPQIDIHDKTTQQDEQQQPLRP